MLHCQELKNVRNRLWSTIREKLNQWKDQFKDNIHLLKI